MFNAFHKAIRPSDFRGPHGDSLSRPRSELEAEVTANRPNTTRDQERMPELSDAYHQRGKLDMGPGTAQRPMTRPRTQGFDSAESSGFDKAIFAREKKRQGEAKTAPPNGTYPSRFGAKNDFSFPPGLSEEAKAEHLSKNTKIQKWKEAQVRQWGGEFGHRSQFTREKGGMHSIMTTATATAKSPFSQSEQDSIVAGEWAPDPNEIEEDGKASGETKSSR
jgi:hypothetical protein